MDQPIPIIKDKKIEEGCDSRNIYMGWNVSTEQSLRERKIELLKQLILKNSSFIEFFSFDFFFIVFFSFDCFF